MYGATGLTTDPSITYNGDVSGIPGSDPTTAEFFPGNVVDPAFFGPDFDISSRCPGAFDVPADFDGFRSRRRGVAPQAEISSAL